MSKQSPSQPAFTEASIRPDDLIVEHERLHQLDLARLHTKKSQFVKVACPACDGKDSQPAWQKDGFEYERCSACGTAFVNPRPTPELLEEYYRTAETYAFWTAKIFPASEATRRERIHRPRAARLVDILKRQGGSPGGTLLEVGAGYGTFCEAARDTGFFKRVIAVEPTPTNAQKCRERGLEVLEMPIESVTLPPQSVDVIASYEVLEHLFAPSSFVAACARMLKPGGLLVLSNPNIRGFEVATLGTVSQTIDLEHLNYFHPDSMRRLLEKQGLELVELLTPGELDAEIVRKRALAGLVDLSAQPFLKHLLLEDWERVGGPFQRFLAENQLSTHMWSVARKRA